MIYPLLTASAPLQQTQTPQHGERAIAEAELICFENPRQGRPYEVSIELPEFTCKCPFSGYPDFAVLRLIYQPGPRVVELQGDQAVCQQLPRSLDFHEEVTNRILDDLVAATDPVWMQLEADFNPRGNVHTVVGSATHASGLLINLRLTSSKEIQTCSRSCVMLRPGAMC